MRLSGGYSRSVQFVNLPASDPGKEGCVCLRSQHVRPEVGATRCWNGGENFSHAHSDEEREKADNDPSESHNAGTSSVQTIRKETVACQYFALLSWRLAGMFVRRDTSYYALGSRRSLALVEPPHPQFRRPTMIEKEAPKLCSRLHSLDNSCV